MSKFDMFCAAGKIIFMIFLVCFMLSGLNPPPSPHNAQQKLQIIARTGPIRSICWEGHVFVNYRERELVQLFTTGPNGLQAVQCQPKEAK